MHYEKITEKTHITTTENPLFLDSTNSKHCIATPNL